MPRLLHAIDDTVDVEYGRFLLQESTTTRHELTCDLDTEARLQSVTATYSEHPLAIAQSGPHHARTHVGNQDRAGQLDQGTFATGVERWLIQLWPAQL